MTDFEIGNITAALTAAGIAYSENEIMAHHTSFKIGGPAGLFAMPKNAGEVRCAVNCAKAAGVKTYILGRGTNVVFDDAGYDGVVISMLPLDSVTVSGNVLTAGCGASLAKAAVAARDADLAGMEFAHGIPGSVGGAVCMNAGAYGGEIAGILLSSTYINLSTGDTVTIGNASHGYGYRESIYKHHPEYVIVEASFELMPGDRAEIGAKMDELMSRRREKQPLEHPSAGSVFKRYPGYYTSQLIDEAGLKGMQIGGAQVSEKHAGFIINKGGATAADVAALVELIKNEIYRQRGFELETEILFVG